MKIIGAEEGLTTGSTRGKSHTAHYVFNAGSIAAVTVRNAADDGDTGSIRINANSGFSNCIFSNFPPLNYLIGALFGLSKQ